MLVRTGYWVGEEVVLRSRVSLASLFKKLKYRKNSIFD